MTWFKVIALAIITGLITGIMMLIPAFKNTSFQDIGTYLECWFLFAIFIIVNCRKWWEASLKCFVFFLISQPLIYLVQVPFNSLGWGIFGYYKTWFIITLLTLPGAAIAFLLKRRDWLSVAVLSVPNIYLALASYSYFVRAWNHYTSHGFPNHLLSAIFCLALGFVFIKKLLNKNKHRTVAAIIFVSSFMAAAITRTAII